MLKIKQNGKIIIINTKLITYVTARTNKKVITMPYQVLIKFTKDNDFMAYFSTENEQEQFLNELITDMDRK